jgi:hypothetical protein
VTWTGHGNSTGLTPESDVRFVVPVEVSMKFTVTPCNLVNMCQYTCDLIQLVCLILQKTVISPNIGI